MEQTTVKEWVIIRITFEEFINLNDKVRDQLPIQSIRPDDESLLEQFDDWKEAKKKANKAYKELKAIEWSIREKNYQK